MNFLYIILLALFFIVCGYCLLDLKSFWDKDSEYDEEE